MKIEIKKTVKGSPDGVRVIEFSPGVHDVPDDLARVFLFELNVARQVIEKPDEIEVAAVDVDEIETPEKPKRRKYRRRKK